MDDQQTMNASGNGGKKSILRYPLRSAAKAKDQPIKSPEPSFQSAPKRGRPPSSMSKSVSVLDLSGKEKSAKPPRRLSIPTKSAASPQLKATSNITPISEARAKRSAKVQEGFETPLSDVSRSSIRRKFCILSSSSYWLQQIRVSEAAAKHSISLGFFKLALEAGCEPLQLLRDELASYARKHNLTEYEENVRGLVESYGIVETLEQLQVSETCSHTPDHSSTVSDEVVAVVHSTNSTTGSRKLRPKSLNIDAQASTAKVSSRKETPQKTTPAHNTRASVNRNSVNRRSITGGANNMKRKAKDMGKPGPFSEDEMSKQKAMSGEVTTKQQDMEEISEGNKENTEATRIVVNAAEEN